LNVFSKGEWGNVEKNDTNRAVLGRKALESNNRPCEPQKTRRSHTTKKHIDAGDMGLPTCGGMRYHPQGDFFFSIFFFVFFVLDGCV